jgi:hypothetical protein
MNNPYYQYAYAKERMKELHQQSERERLLKPYKLSWRVKSAKALHDLAKRLEPNEAAEAIS